MPFIKRWDHKGNGYHFGQHIISIVVSIRIFFGIFIAQFIEYLLSNSFVIYFLMQNNGL